MSSNQMLFAWPSVDYMAFIKGIKSSETVKKSHQTIMDGINSCLDGDRQTDFLELDVTGPALHWAINELTENAMGVGWAIMGRPLEVQLDTDITGVLHNKQVSLNNSIMSNISSESVGAKCEDLPNEVYRSDALRANTNFVTEKFERLKAFYSQAAAKDNAIISYSG